MSVVRQCEKLCEMEKVIINFYGYHDLGITMDYEKLVPAITKIYFTTEIFKIPECHKKEENHERRRKKTLSVYLVSIDERQ